METLVLEVSQQDIDTAGEGCGYCPIAKALERKFPGCWPWVGAETSVSFTVDHKERIRFPHTYESLEFVSKYDHGGVSEVAPCTLVFKAGPLHV